MKNAPLKKIVRLVGKAIGDFDLIQDGDRILVALSGGKDSWSLLYALESLRRKAPVKYQIAAATVIWNRKTPGFNLITAHAGEAGFAHAEIDADLVGIVNENLTTGTNPCSFCARLRRGFLYSYASANNYNKLALGHHLDDFVETLMMNMFFNGTIKGMSPKLVADDGKNTVIRPMVYVREHITRACAENLRVPILNCACAYQGMTSDKRRWMKSFLSNLEIDIPDVKSSLLASMGRVRNRHLFPEIG